MSTVHVKKMASGVAVIAMEDRSSQNTFTDEFINDLIHAFDDVNADDNVKVIVLHGYDKYFCCGGSKGELVSIYEGRKSFTDLGFYRVIVDSRVPVICAMQGHALGAGFAFACYGDMMVMAREALYSTNFMKYGFTPGFGSTYIVPQKMGDALGKEMLFSANYYHGGALENRGVSCAFTSKDNVIATAMSLAEELADKSLVSLKLLKSHYRSIISEPLDRAVEQELEMHRISFAQPEVKERIEALF